MRGKAAAGAPYACVPLDPVDPQHAMVLAGRHVEWPADLSREEWVSFLGMAATIAGSSPRRLVMANLGLRSGASQQHVHAHVMPDPSWGLESTGDYCALCFGEVETLCGVGDAMLAFLPGGMDGEMVLYPHGHGVRPMDFVHDASFVLVRLWAALREAGVHSGMLAWHFAGHQHMHVAPALSPPAAESIAGFSVQRLAHGQLACLLGGG